MRSGTPDELLAALIWERFGPGRLAPPPISNGRRALLAVDAATTDDELSRARRRRTLCEALGGANELDVWEAARVP